MRVCRCLLWIVISGLLYAAPASTAEAACLVCRCFFHETGWTNPFKANSDSGCKSECIDNGFMCSIGGPCIPTMRAGRPQVLQSLPADQCPARLPRKDDFPPCLQRGGGILRC